MSISLITPPAEEPVSVPELLAAAKFDIDDTDPNQVLDLESKLLTARQYVEGELSRALITSTWQLNLCHWPWDRGYIELPLGNLQSVGQITYLLPGATNPEIWDASNYKLARTYDPNAGVDDAGAGRLYKAYMVPWPPGPMDVGEPITIPFTCGWKDPASVPDPIKTAIKMLASWWFRNPEAAMTGRGDVSIEVAFSVSSLLQRYKIYD